MAMENPIYTWFPSFQHEWDFPSFPVDTTWTLQSFGAWILKRREGWGHQDGIGLHGGLPKSSCGLYTVYTIHVHYSLEHIFFAHAYLHTYHTIPYHTITQHEFIHTYTHIYIYNLYIGFVLAWWTFRWFWYIYIYVYIYIYILEGFGAQEGL